MYDGLHHPFCHGPARNISVRWRASRFKRIYAERVCRTAALAGACRSRFRQRYHHRIVDGDDHNEPVADAVRSILDGHIVLDRAIAERNRYPAINILRSISRTMPDCDTKEEYALVAKARKYISAYEDMAELIRLGAYKKGSNREVDEAIFYYPKIEAFLSQGKQERFTLPECYQQLEQILSIPYAAEA